MNDPPRMLDDPDELSPDERRVLLAGKRVAPTARVRRAVWLGVAAQLKAGAAAATGSTAVGQVVGASTAGTSAGFTSAGAGAAGAAAAGATATGFVAAKWFGLGVLVGATSLGLVEVVRRSGPTPPTSVTSSVPVGSIAVGTLGALETSANSQRSIDAKQTQPEHSSDGSRGRLPVKDEPGDALRVDPTSSASKEEAQQSAQEPAGMKASPKHSQISQGVALQASQRIPSPNIDPVRDEARRVSRARALIRSEQSGQALNELGQLDRDYPQGTLLQEREALEVEALVTSGQLQPAREQAARFHQKYPGSPHAARLRSIVGE